MGLSLSLSEIAYLFLYLQAMKRYLSKLFIAIAFFTSGNSYLWATSSLLSRAYSTASAPSTVQTPTSEFAQDSSSVRVWRVEPITGDTITTHRDTISYNFQARTLAEAWALGVGYLGNLGSPSYAKTYFDNPEISSFYPLTAIYPYLPTAQNNIFFDTKIPYSNLHYQTAGAKRNKEERLKGLITSNFGKNTNIGFNIDYLYARGYYQYLSNKSTSYNLFASHRSGRYQMHAWAGNSSMMYSENGGMANDLFVINPDSPELPSTSYTSNDFPVRMEDTWNRVKHKQLFFTNSYELGYLKRTQVPPRTTPPDTLQTNLMDTNRLEDLSVQSDTTPEVAQKATETADFVPVAKAFFTSDYSYQSRLFTSSSSELDNLYSNVYYTALAHDYSTLSEWRNSVGITLKEQFRPWVKFGLTAYLSNKNQVYTTPSDIYGERIKKNRNTTYVGGILKKTLGKHLRYNIKTEFAVLGTDLGELRVEGDIHTATKIKSNPINLQLFGHIYNLKPDYSIANVYSKYFQWSEDLADTRKVKIGGRVVIPHTKTSLSLQVENVQNLAYLDANSTIAQHESNVQILAGSIEQNLKLRALHWNNKLSVQSSSNKEVVPLPGFTLYSNLYLLTRIAGVLSVQMGVDVHYHSSYKAPAYEPALMQFYNQQTTNVGGFPLSTAYINAHLKKTRFFIMYYNIFQNAGNNGYFSIPHYPVNPTHIRWGLSWDFNN